MSRSPKTVIIVKDNYPLTDDTRVLKITQMLRASGFDIKYIGWNWQQKHNSASPDGPVLDLTTKYGAHRFILFPIWWGFTFIQLLTTSWDFIHVVNLPSLLPAIVVAKLKRKKVIYDIEDVYIDQQIVPSIIRNLVISFDIILMHFVDAIILVDELQKYEFGTLPKKRITVIYDTPFDINSNKDYDAENNDTFDVFYAGGINKQRHLHLESMIDAITQTEGTRLIIAGYGDELIDYIKLQSNALPDKILYKGALTYAEVLKHSLNCSLLFNLRSPLPLVNTYICGSKFLEALMCGKPILINKNTSAALKVKKEKCGVTVDAQNIPSIIFAINHLKNNKSYAKLLGNNGRRAYENKYSWSIMQEDLTNLYQTL